MLITLIYLIFIGAPAILLLWVGVRYGRRDDSDWVGALGRSLLWSFPTCWAVLFGGAGHGPAIFPFPSLLILLGLQGPGVTGVVPSPWVSLAVPIAACFLGLLWTRVAPRRVADLTHNSQNGEP